MSAPPLTKITDVDAEVARITALYVEARGGQGLCHRALAVVTWQDEQGREQAAVLDDWIDPALVALHPEWIAQGRVTATPEPWKPDRELAAAGWYR